MARALHGQQLHQVARVDSHCPRLEVMRRNGPRCITCEGAQGLPDPQPKGFQALGLRFQGLSPVYQFPLVRHVRHCRLVAALCPPPLPRTHTTV